MAICPRCKKKKSSDRFRNGAEKLKICKACHIETTGVKYCMACKKFKTVGDFAPTKAPSPDGRDTKCMVCKKIESKKREKARHDRESLRYEDVNSAFRGIDLEDVRKHLKVSAILLTKKRWNAETLAESIREAGV